MSLAEEQEQQQLVAQEQNSEPDSPVQKVWKPELYKIQLEAPTPKPLPYRLYQNCNNSKSSLEITLQASGHSSADREAIAGYGIAYHGEMGHQTAEQLLNNMQDGTYLLRRSPTACSFYTLSVRFNKRTKHFKIYYTRSAGHYLKEQSKHYDTIQDLVADGLITFYMQQHAGPIIQQMNQQTRNCYQLSPYMTLNRRKLRALSNELQRSILTKSNVSTEWPSVPRSVCMDAGLSNFFTGSTTIGDTTNNNKNNNSNNNNNNNNNNSKITSPTTSTGSISKDIDVTDAILPAIYERAHNFKVHTFKGLNWCELCANFLWGFTAQGVKCDACGFVAHAKCSELVPAKCMPDLKRIRGVFGTDLTTMVQLHQCTVPFVVRRCVEEVETRGMLQEGIYRVSGFADEIDALKLALDRDGETTDMSEAAYGNVNVIAGTLKLYLRLLPVPLVTFNAYPSFMQASRLPTAVEQIQNMKEAARRLPSAHYNCLKFMLEHLKRVASHYVLNKMNEHNLATVFAPTLIATPQHMTNLTEEIFMLSMLIAHCDAICI